MVSKMWVLECYYCFDQYVADTFNGLVKWHSVYKKKSVNPFADKLIGFDRLPKYRGFCNDECAEKYFTEIEPRQRAFYKKIKPKKDNIEFTDPCQNRLDCETCQKKHKKEGE